MFFGIAGASLQGRNSTLPLVARLGRGFPYYAEGHRVRDVRGTAGDFAAISSVYRATRKGTGSLLKL